LQKLFNVYFCICFIIFASSRSKLLHFATKDY